MIRKTIRLATDAFAHPLAIVAVPVACWLASRVLSETALTLVLSIVAISFTQLILYASACDDRALHAKVDELIRAIEDADDALIGKEREER
jgi:low affinity Fe/Cu permease